MVATKITNQLNEQLSKGAESLGELVWWSLRDVRIHQSDVENLVEGLDLRDHQGHKIDVRKICPRLQARGALRKALEDLGIRSGSSRRKTKRTQTNNGRTILARRLDAKDDLSIPAGDFVMVLVEEDLDRSGDKAALDWHEIQRITYSSALRTIQFSTRELVQEISQGFADYGLTYKAAEVAACLKSMIEYGHGIVARESGGVYFVPRQHVSVAAAAEKLCSSIQGALFVRFPVLAGAAGSSQQNQTREMVGSALRKELENLREDLLAMQEQARDPDTASLRGSTIKKRLDRYRVLRHKAVTYRELLGIEDQKIKDEINRMAQAARELLA